MTLAGFQGTVNEVQWGKLLSGVGQKYVLASGGDVTSAGRTLTVPPRVDIGCGVMVEENASTNITVPTPAAGQWHLLVLRRSWSTRTAAYQLIPGATTADAAQTAPPATLPAARQKTPGITDDEPVAWVHTRASTTLLSIWQLSAKSGGVVPGPWALLDPVEQGMGVAYSESTGEVYAQNGTSWRLYTNGDWIVAPNLSQWGTLARLSYRKRADGVVELLGHGVKAAGYGLFVLPVGMRPGVIGADTGIRTTDTYTPTRSFVIRGSGSVEYGDNTSGQGIAIDFRFKAVG